MTDVWSPRDIARTIAEDEHAWTDADAVLVAKAYLELTEVEQQRHPELIAHHRKAYLAMIEAEQHHSWRGVYPGMCHDPELCRGRTSCPRDRSCCE